MVQEMFCDCQDYAKGNSQKASICNLEYPEAQLFCTAHLCESSAYPCPYNPSEIYNQNGIFRIAHKDPEGNLVGRCEDFQSTQSHRTLPKTKPRKTSETPSPSKPPQNSYILKNFQLECKLPKRTA